MPTTFSIRPHPVFIVGCWCSGTTLFRDLLGSHPHLAFGTESHFIPRVLVRHGDPTSEVEARRMGVDICRYLKSRRYPLEIRAEDFDHCRSAAQAVALPFERLADHQGKPRWGDKTPHYVEHIDMLLGLFPTAKFLHIIRDGRDCALAVQQRYFGPNTTYHAARVWHRQVRRGREARDRLGADVVQELHYEELVAEPEATLRRVLEFLNEPWDRAVLRRSPKFCGLKTARFGRPLPTPFDGDQVDSARAQRWPSTMADDEQAIFEGVAGDLLEELGYATRGIRREPGLVERTLLRIENDTKRIWRHAQYGMLGAQLRDQFMRVRARFPSL